MRPPTAGPDDPEKRLVSYFRRLDGDGQRALLILAREAVDIRHEHPASSRTLLSRLRVQHHCHRADDPEFVQLQPSASGVRSWKCCACGEVVTLPRAD